MQLGLWDNELCNRYYATEINPEHTEEHREIILVVSPTTLLQIQLLPNSKESEIGTLVNWATLHSLANIRKQKHVKNFVIIEWKAIESRPAYSQ
jgi:hypothetical protein